MAVVIELLSRALQHEIEAYSDFVQFRKALHRTLGRKPSPERVARRLAARRSQLLARMRRRRKAESKKKK